MSAQVVVGYNGSRPSAEAVWWAAREALARGSPLRIVCCYEIATLAAEAPTFPAVLALDSLLTGTRETLNAMSSVVASTYPELKLTGEASAGPATVVLVDGLEPDDLVVIGASGRDGAAARLLGDTSRQVVRHAACPVVVVRDETPHGRPSRIVVGVDGSSSSDRAVRWAADEADLHRVALCVVHGWWHHDAHRATAAHDVARVDAACVLERSVELARERCGADVVGQLIESHPVTTLLGTVRDGDLLVLGSRGRGAFRSSLFGSTVRDVVDRCPRSVVVVHDAVRELDSDSRG